MANEPTEQHENGQCCGYADADSDDGFLHEEKRSSLRLLDYGGFRSLFQWPQSCQVCQFRNESVRDPSIRCGRVALRKMAVYTQTTSDTIAHSTTRHLLDFFSQQRSFARKADGTEQREKDLSEKNGDDVNDNVPTFH